MNDDNPAPAQPPTPSNAGHGATAAPQRADHGLPPMRRRPILDRGFYIILGLAVSGGLLTLLLKGWDVFVEVIVQDAGFLLILAPKVAAGVIIAVLLPIFVEPATLNRWVGPERGWQGLALAGAFGAAAPGGPSVVFTLAIGLLGAGADRGAVGAFVTGWALLSLNRTLVWELAFIPYDLVVLRFLLTMPIPVAVGLTMRRLSTAP